MRSIFILLIIISTHVAITAQDSWTDYIIGRPISGYMEAKKATAQEWGIQYKAIAAGCVISDEISQKAAEYEKNNALYFETLARQYGTDWKYYFELDVKKKLAIAQSKHQTEVLYEIVMEATPNKAYYTTKQLVAKAWGINYQAKFITGELSESVKAAIQKDMLASNAYEVQLNTIFGANWKETFLKEVALAVAKNNTKQTNATSNMIWTDYVLGKPHLAYFEAKEALAKEWGINYQAKFMGCVLRPKMEKERKRVNQKNTAYFAVLNQQYGEDWKSHFDRAVQKKLASQK
ncbi:FEKKY domain-containing protein [Aureispira anguillae]|uniref:Uncharacterized protein n=1 Tax=Aureispira anguillae TaxID=2864201 RepID=A0A915YHK4_9BACT|nr:hypothetical protein [Aureispira anguillae]BDS13325.1 hypothetical protein AsAng_0040610 [Aureispira anguillae]